MGGHWKVRRGCLQRRSAGRLYRNHCSRLNPSAGRAFVVTAIGNELPYHHPSCLFPHPGAVRVQCSTPNERSFFPSTSSLEWSLCVRVCTHACMCACVYAWNNDSRLACLSQGASGKQGEETFRESGLVGTFTSFKLAWLPLYQSGRPRLTMSCLCGKLAGVRCPAARWWWVARWLS